MLSILQAAGWPIIPLLLASIVALALIVERWLSLRVARIAPPTLVDEVIGVTKSHLPTNDTIQKLADNSLLGRVLAEGFKVAANEPRAPEARLRQALESAGRDAVHAMERYLNALGTIASAAPAASAEKSRLSFMGRPCVDLGVVVVAPAQRCGSSGGRLARQACQVGMQKGHGRCLGCRAGLVGDRQVPAGYAQPLNYSRSARRMPLSDDC